MADFDAGQTGLTISNPGHKSDPVMIEMLHAYFHIYYFFACFASGPANLDPGFGFWFAQLAIAISRDVLVLNILPSLLFFL